MIKKEKEAVPAIFKGMIWNCPKCKKQFTDLWVIHTLSGVQCRLCGENLLRAKDET